MNLLFIGKYLTVKDKHVPYGDDVADAACKDKEVKDGMHVTTLVETVENGTGDIEDTLGDNPYDGSGADRCQERLERHEDGKPHAHETEGLHIAVLLETAETDDGAGNGRQPHKAEESPAIGPIVAQRYQRDGRIGPSYAPVDGSMVPTAQTLLPLAVAARGMIDGGGEIGGSHAKQVESHSQLAPTVDVTEEEQPKQDAHHYPHGNAGGVRPGVELLFFLGVSDSHTLLSSRYLLLRFFPLDLLPAEEFFNGD